MKIPSAEWEKFASSEPYFAVFTHSKFLRRNFTGEAEGDFFGSGQGYVEYVYDTARNRVHPKFMPTSVLELGVGPGRVAIPFARRAQNVTAVDVSPAMLEVARRNAERFGVSNITFQSLEELRRTNSTYELVNASLVFQYVDPREGVELFREMLHRIGPLGVGVFQFAYRRTISRRRAAGRWMRSRVPGVNATLNVLRGRDAAFPILDPKTYDLDQILGIVREEGFPEPYVVHRKDGELDLATLFIRREAKETTRIDVRELIARTSIEELNRTAEQYFAGLTDWQDLLAKPFAKVGDTPPILINLATILEGLKLYPGLTILEFGAGTGWLSRFLTQLGYHAILMDVSPTALMIARELYDRMPVIGTRPAPRFLTFNGRRIDLPDASVDRIICFDAFHHAPNPDDVLAEFARVLRPGGIAGFAEPGPEHSRTASSQFEMRTHGVVENDIDIHAIWETARRVGFSDLRLAGLSPRGFSMSIDEYDDLLAGGPTLQRWAATARQVMENGRDFFLHREGVEPSDSRRIEGLACSIFVTAGEAAVRAGDSIPVQATVINSGRTPWLESDDKVGAVWLGCHLFDGEGNLVRFEYHWERIPKALAPGESVTFDFAAPPLDGGAYQIEFDCVARDVTWFAMVGSNSPRVSIKVG